MYIFMILLQVFDKYMDRIDLGFGQMIQENKELKMVFQPLMVFSHGFLVKIIITSYNNHLPRLVDSYALFPQIKCFYCKHC